MESVNGLDLDSARRTSGNGFYYLQGNIARLHSAILSYACNTVVQMGREYRASKKFLEQSEKFLAYARERSEQFRRELAQYAAATKEAYERVMNDTLQSISQCIEHQDPDILFAGINKAGAVFGVRYQFQSFEEFDEFMSDEDSVFVF